MPLTIHQVDAFTDRAFGGNPAAVCILSAPAGELWMKHVAREMNLSETAFLVPESEGYRLRWLTPTVEVDLCGHATLASAHILWEQGHLPAASVARFFTRSGRLTATKRGDEIVLDFPATPVQRPAVAGPFIEALGATPRAAWWNRFDALLEFEDESIVRNMKPNFARLGRIEARGVIVTAPSSNPSYDFVSRFFAPASGIDEDPVTGSAHCTLGPYWRERLGRDELTGYQASERGGIVGLKMVGDRVDLIGKAVTVMRGTLIGDAAQAF